jgi:phosphoserine phosphatase RsbU/P
MFNLEPLLGDLIHRIREGEPLAFEEFSDLVSKLFAFYLLGSGVGLHGADVAQWVTVGIASIVASAHAAWEPYTEWLERQFEDILYREFFHSAASFQERLMCELAPLPGGIEAHAVLRPCHRVSGDLILAAPHGEEAWFAVGDVTGHGTAAALCALVLSHLVQTAQRELAGGADEDPLSAVARMVNAEILRNKRGNIALPLILARVVVSEQRVEILNCGSPAIPLLLRDGEVSRIEENGMALGYFSDPFLPVRREALAPGDVLVLPTDGLVEQPNADGGMYTNNGLAEALRSAPSRAPREVAEHLFNAVDTFAGGSRQTDDQSLLVIRFSERAGWDKL